jgi:YfiH family protein
MTSEWVEADGLLRNDRLSRLKLRHGFTTRRAGNMKDESRRREAAAKLGLPAALTLKQVHGVKIHLASEVSAGAEGDGWLIDKSSVPVAVYVADCVPLYVWSDDGKAAGVFHAGWRGTAKGMAKAAVAAFRDRLGVPASRLSAAVGPHAGPCCYRVGPELEKEFPASAFVRRGGDLFLDLAAETRRQLVEAGLPAASAGAGAPCTICRPDAYFSFRRDKQDARMLALLSLERWPS